MRAKPSVMVVPSATARSGRKRIGAPPFSRSFETRYCTIVSMVVREVLGTGRFKDSAQLGSICICVKFGVLVLG